MMMVNNPFGQSSMDLIEQNAAVRVGKRIRKVRESKGLSQAELGELVGLSADRIQKYENGKRKPKTELLKSIANALEVDALALADPTTTSYIPAMYAIFELAEIFNMKLEKSPEGKKLGYSLSVDYSDGIYGYFEEWYKVYERVQAQLDVATTKEERENIMKEYHNWQWNFPQGVIDKTTKYLQKSMIKDKIEELQRMYDKLDEE